MEGTNVRVQTKKDHVIKALPSMRLGLDNVELTTAASPLIPENRTLETKPSSEDTNLNSLTFLLNDKKRRGDGGNRESSEGGIGAGSLIEPFTERTNKDSDKNEVVADAAGEVDREKEDSEVQRGRTSRASSPVDIAPKLSSSEVRDREPERERDRDRGRERDHDLEATVVVPTFHALSSDDLAMRKADYLRQYEEKNKDYRYNAKKLSMEDEFEDIRNALAAVRVRRDHEVTLDAYKKRLFMLVKGLVIVNNFFGDKWDLELDKWAEVVHDDLEHAGTYDDLLEELMQKYTNYKAFPVEARLAFSLASGLVIGVFQRKQLKAELRKRQEDERLMERKIDERVQESMARFQRTMMEQNARNNQANANEGRFQMPASYAENVGSKPQDRASSGGVKGPTLSRADFLRAMEQSLDDSDDDGTSSTSSASSTASSAVSLKSRASTVPDNVTRPLSPLPDTRASSPVPKLARKEEVPASVRGGRKTRGTGVARGSARGTVKRGRPRKGEAEEVNAVIAE